GAQKLVHPLVGCADSLLLQEICAGTQTGPGGAELRCRSRSALDATRALPADTRAGGAGADFVPIRPPVRHAESRCRRRFARALSNGPLEQARSEDHTSELQS